MSMMRRGGLVLAGGLAVGVLGPACAPSEKDPVVTVSAAEPHINDTGASTTLTITVLDEASRKGTGVVRVTTKVGMFGEEGNNTLVTLSEGSATVPFTCPTARDSSCALGVASISADWRGNVGRGKVYVGERGLLLLQGKTGTTVPPPTSGGGDPLATGALTDFTPNQVYLFGSLSTTGSGSNAISSLSQPMKLFVGFQDNSVYSMVLRPNGEILYSSGNSLYRAVPDEFTQAGTGTGYPTTTSLNDVPIPTPCDVGARTAYSVHPNTGDVYFQCNGPGGEIKSQATGATAVPADTTKKYILLKVGSGGTKLVTDAVSSSQFLYLLDGGNEARRVDLTANPDTGLMLRSSARARPEGGFYFVYSNRSSDLLQLWSLNNAGVWAGVGAYPSRLKLPTGYSMGRDEFVLDSSNNAYAIVQSSTGFAIARFSLGASAPTLVYAESNRPADAGWNHWPPKLYNMINSSLGSMLVTGP